ncbi:hypothetical protein WCX72_02040 [Sulfurimonas sp. HSL1-6]|uniref:hypothetical protein n=1 Tax=Thiomicrolovo immobilis TaxID=3131935 RepID=UPI0031F81911
MKETIESINRQFDALIAKIDPLSAEMLRDRDYAVQLADCVTRSYVMLNDGMNSEHEVCCACALERDYLREAMARLELIGQTGEVDTETERFYFEFVASLWTIRRHIAAALSRL